MGKIGLNIPLTKTYNLEQAILLIALGTKYAKNDLLPLRFKSFVERPGGNFRWQGPKDWQLGFMRKQRYIGTTSAKLKVFHYPKQYGVLYYNDKKEDDSAILRSLFRQKFGEK